MEWDNPCSHLLDDLRSGIDAEEIAARYGLDADATVPDLGTIVGLSCMAGSDTGLEAVSVNRRVGDDVYEYYIIADGGAATDWDEYFTLDVPGVERPEMRPTEYGWTSEPPGLSSGLQDQPAWQSVADVIDSW
jgi:hypothetical protein